MGTPMRHELLIGGRFEKSELSKESALEVIDPYTEQVVAYVDQASPQQMKKAIEASIEAFKDNKFV